MSSLAQLSVIIPCYNARPYIAATLRSVLAQEGVALEVVLVDDGSTDGSAEFVQQAFPQVRVLRQANAGVAAARNRGIAAASHDWLAFVDADDLWLPGKLAAQWAQLQSMPQARLAYTAWAVWQSDQAEPDPGWLSELQLQAEQPARWGGPSGDVYADLLLDCCVWTGTVVMARSLLDEVGGFDPALRVGEDYDLWLRISRITPILHLPRPFALYRQSPASLTRAVPKLNHKALVVDRAILRFGYRSPLGRSAPQAAVARGLARSWADFAGAQLMGGNPGAARAAAITAIRTFPRQSLGWKVLAKAAWRGWMR